jgi:hypothetical protein
VWWNKYCQRDPYNSPRWVLDSPTFTSLSSSTFRKEDLVQVTLECPNLDFPIRLPLMQMNQLTSELLLTEIERVLPVPLWCFSFRWRYRLSFRLYNNPHSLHGKKLSLLCFLSCLSRFSIKQTVSNVTVLRWLIDLFIVTWCHIWKPTRHETFSFCAQTPKWTDVLMYIYNMNQTF